MPGFVILFVILAGFILLVRNSVSPDPYLYDEADYLYATLRGPLSNAFEAGAIPVTKLIATGLNGRTAAGQRVALSEWLRTSDDISFYRHWHGPLAFYYLMLVDAIGRSEMLHRASMLLFPLLTIVVVWFGCRRIVPGGMSLSCASLACVLLGWNFIMTRSSEIAPHQLYVLTYAASLVLLCIAIRTRDRRYWYGAVASAALGFATLEMAAFLAITLLAIAWKERAGLRTDAGMLIRSAGLFIAVVFAVWPAAILRGSFLKAFFSLAYIAHFRKPWGEMTVADAWRLRLLHSPVQWALIALAVGLFFAIRNLPVRRVASPLLVFGGLTLVFLSRVANDVPRYDLPYAPALDIFAGLVIGSVMSRWRPAARATAISAVAAACFATAWIAMAPQTGGPGRESQVLEAIRRGGLQSSRLVVPHDDLPVIHYYFPHTVLRPYDGASPDPADLKDSDALIETGVPVRIERLHNAAASRQPF